MGLYAETPQQALNEVILAKTAWLEAAKAENKNIPKPRYRPVIYQIVAVVYHFASVVALKSNLALVCLRLNCVCRYDIVI